mgnify:CR=1 FL=1
MATYNNKESIQWVIDAIERGKNREVPNTNVITDTSTDNADKSINRCDKCDIGWEETYRHGRKLYLYYKSYVKLGKDFKRCPRCRKG